MRLSARSLTLTTPLMLALAGIAQRSEASIAKMADANSAGTSKQTVEGLVASSSGLDGTQIHAWTNWDFWLFWGLGIVCPIIAVFAFIGALTQMSQQGFSWQGTGGTLVQTLFILVVIMVAATGIYWVKTGLIGWA